MTVAGKGGRPKRATPVKPIVVRLEPDTVMDADRIAAARGWSRHKTLIALIELGVSTWDVASAELGGEA